MTSAISWEDSYRVNSQHSAIHVKSRKGGNVMKRETAMIIVSCAVLFSLPASEQMGFAASVETVGELKTSGGIRFSDESLQTSACSGCAELVPIERGGTGADTASEARINLGVPGIATANTFTLGPQTLLSGAAGLNALIVQGAVGQSANLQEWRDSGGTTLVSVGSGGDINLPATAVIRSAGALFIHSTTDGGFFAGMNAGNQSMSGQCNTAIGEYAFDENTTGHNNTAAGYLALTSNTTGNFNIAIGRAALASNTEGQANSAIGYYSMSHNLNGGNNTALGHQSLYNNTSSHSTAIGANTLFSNTEGGFNTAIGSNSLNANSKGSYNTAGGYQALRSNTTAGKNTALGAIALYTQSFSNGNVFWDSHNTAVGHEALYANQPTATDNGIYNTAIGSGSLRANTTGYNNTAGGALSLYSNNTGYNNTAYGFNALQDNTNGFNNTANGVFALRNNTSGYYNSAVGISTLYTNTVGNFNTATGYSALYNNTDGDANTGVGRGAGYTNTTGNYNTFVGHGADASASNLTNATAIGYNAEVNASNKVRIGNGSVTVIEGQVGWTFPSDIRIKKDVEDIGQGLDFIKALRPVQYRLKNGNDRIDFGFIAQDIEALLGTDYNVLGIGADQDRTLSLRYTDFIAPMVKAMQEQQGMIEKQNGEIQTQKEQITLLQERLARLEELLTSR
jgi:hypothetical protein